MSVGDLVTGTNLGPEFDLGGATPGSLTLKLGSGLQQDGSGNIFVMLGTTVMPQYEYKEIWVEESAAIGTGLAEWSWGNGDAGFIGQPVGSGWEITEFGFNADVGGAAGSFTGVSVYDLSLIHI